MMEGEVYSDFVLLWLLCHQSRVEGEKPSDCWLEKWMKVAEDQGIRALDHLRNGVKQAIEALGRGFLEYYANAALRDKLMGGELSAQEYYRQLLRMVYRLLFLFVAEDRDLLLNPEAPQDARDRYIHYYSTQRLRRMAETFKGTRHPDLFESLRLVMRLLSGENNGAGAAGLGLVPLGSFLFSDRAVPDIIDCQISNQHLLTAVRALSLTYDQRAQVYRTVDYKNLGSDELGSVFESLLELHPQINVLARHFALATAAGNERKTTGSYYTPESLVYALLDSALNPVLEEAVRGKNKPSSPSPSGFGNEGSTPEQRILALKVCDPACGSGHFLIAAANRMAKALAFVRTGEEEPPPTAIQEAKRDIISHCIYGVDINPMAVELCKVNLWMEALEPGKPLNFLDHRIQVGNSLLGTTPKLMAGGIPDEALSPIAGDDPTYANQLKRLNRQERKSRETGQSSMFEQIEPPANYGYLTSAMHALDDTPDDTLDAVQRKEAQYAALASDPEYVKARLLADAWCAAFVWEKKQDGLPMPMTDLLYRRMEKNPLAENLQTVREYVVELKERYQFFHWHVAFPDVFSVDAPTQPPSPALPPQGEGGQPSTPAVPPTTQAQVPPPEGEGFRVGAGAEAGAAPEGEGSRVGAYNPQTGWRGGFDVVLGNPPWERIKIQEREWFAERLPEIANAPNAAARRRMIEALRQSDPKVYADFQADLRKAEGASHFVRVSQRYPLCGRGDVNTYAIFAEAARHIIHDRGRVGLIVPSGIATDDTTKFFFQDVVQSGSLVSLYDFENREGLFPAVDSRVKFSLMTMTGREASAPQAEFAFFLHRVEDLDDPERRFSLSAEEIAMLNPNTRTMPTFRSVRDAEITKAIYRRVPILIREAAPTPAPSSSKRGERVSPPEGERYRGGDENPWGISFLCMFHMANDSHLFRTRQELQAEGYTLRGNHFMRGAECYLPLYEAKMMHQFTHRWATYDSKSPHLRRGDLEGGLSTRKMTLEELRSPHALPLPRYWVDAREVAARLDFWDKGWLLGFRDITNTTNERTAIFGLIPRVGVGNKVPVLFSDELLATSGAVFKANAAACVFDFVARQKLGGTTMNFFYVKQFPVIPPHTYTQALLDFIVPRALELTYTAWDLQPFAQDVGYHGPPFVWDEERRFLLRCELDALYFHLYPIERDDVDYIMETFPMVKRKDEAKHGEYLTKRVILEMYDQMAALPTMSVPAPKNPPRHEGEGASEGEGVYAVPDVRCWETWLSPPPADPRAAHPDKRD
ncbi:MAG: N-6 DNA methylase [Aggregatilineales bacterium]